MTHIITQTHHTNPNLPTSVVFLMIHDKLLIECGQHESFNFFDLSAFDGMVLAYHGSDENSRFDSGEGA